MKIEFPLRIRTGAFLLLLLFATSAWGADHPELPKTSECLSCHLEKTKGKSIHFDFAQDCRVCHAVSVTEGKTSISLVLPKERICYSCHEKAAMDQMQFMQGECLSCHLAHNSPGLHLLRANVSLSRKASQP